MAEEKISGGEMQEKEAYSLEPDGEVSPPRESEPNFEKKKEKSQEKVEQAKSQIASSAPASDDKDVVASHVKDVAQLETAEDQIKKLTEIATQNGPKTALKVAKNLNSNYAMDEMHDRLIDEEELRQVLLSKGFIDQV